MTPGFAMQTSPGHYQPNILEGMDWFMNEASIRGLKVTWVLVDNWHAVGGIDQYAGWAGKGHNDFFSDGSVKQLYKALLLLLQPISTPMRWLLKRYEELA